MSKKCLYTLWGVLFSLCGGLGFIPGLMEQVPAALQAILTVLSLASFLPPAMLVYSAKKAGDAHTIKLVRNLSALSLGVTLLVLVLSLATAMASEAVGNFLHVVLILVSSPMVCSGCWVLSLFLWACLLMACLKQESGPRAYGNTKCL